MSKTVSRFALASGVALATAFTVSCTSDIETAEEILAKLSSSSEGSSSPSGSVSCRFPNGECSEITLDACNFLNGILVQSCGAASSSSAPLSSSVAVSSSSAGSSSSYLVQSSSSFALPSSSSVSSVVYGTPVTYGGETYQTVVIGTQTWFAKNLNYDPGIGTSVCYSNQASNCTTYGRLYDWATAKTACPPGWHLPTQADWDVMTAYIGGANTEGKKLKAKSGWNSNGNGTDDYGFSALPGGGGFENSSFGSVGRIGLWWNASENNSSNAYYRGMSHEGEGAYWSNDIKSFLFSVRCIKD